MPEYIDRELARKAVCERCDFYGIGADECGECFNPADEIPAADVRPAVRGRWIFDRGDLATCSNCGSEILKRDVRNHKFCHYCGADMRKEEVQK